jgi:4-amino-4-deoxy-L-arabinose transferase-like glycosyltransferase
VIRDPTSPPAPAAADRPWWEGRPELAAFLLVAASTLFHLWYAGLPELSPQEAYYWLWGQHLDWSYYDHPPLAAWTIRALGEALGHSERAIRSAAALHSCLFSLFFFLAARRLVGARGALAAVLIALLTPLFALGQVVITPDGPLLATWAAAIYFTVRALDEERGPWLLAAGLATGLAALSKYTGWLLAPQIFLALLLDPRGRRMLLSPWPWAGLLLALAAFSPVVLWNAGHGWVSFGFQFGQRAATAASPSISRVLRFVGLQLLVPSPVLALCLWAAAFGALWRLWDRTFRIAALFSVPPLALFAAVSPFTWVKGNWPAVAWPAAMIAAVAFWQAGRAPRWLVRSALGLAAFFTVYLHLAPVVPALPFPARDDTTRGWRALAARVQAERERIGPGAFVIGCYYKTAALLHYYLPGRPSTSSSEALGGNGLQFRFWTDPALREGRQGIVVRDDRDRGPWCPEMESACRPLEELPWLEVERPGMWDLSGRLPRRVATFRLWRCRYAGAPAGGATPRP